MNLLQGENPEGQFRRLQNASSSKINGLRQLFFRRPTMAFSTFLP
jgi:hypothetical protein